MFPVKAIVVYETDEVLLLTPGVAQGNIKMGQVLNVIFHPARL